MVANWGSHAFAALVGLSVPVAAFTGFGSQNINTGPGRLKELALEEKAVDLPNG